MSESRNACGNRLPQVNSDAGEDEMNDAQSDADSQCHGTYDCAPHEVTLMHLTQQCEHQQPRRGDRNQLPWVAIAEMSRQSARAQRQCDKVKQAQGPLQRDMQMQGSKMSR